MIRGRAHHSRSPNDTGVPKTPSGITPGSLPGVTPQKADYYGDDDAGVEERTADGTVQWFDGDPPVEPGGQWVPVPGGSSDSDKDNS